MFTDNLLLSLHFQWLPDQQNCLVALFRASQRGVLASLSVLCTAGHGFNPDGAVCCAGGERPAGSSVWGLLWLLWLLRRGQYLNLRWDEFSRVYLWDEFYIFEGKSEFNPHFCYYIIFTIDFCVRSRLIVHYVAKTTEIKDTWVR